MKDTLLEKVHIYTCHLFSLVWAYELTYSYLKIFVLHETEISIKIVIYQVSLEEVGENQGAIWCSIEDNVNAGGC